MVGSRRLRIDVMMAVIVGREPESMALEWAC